ncbi:cardiomyopathy-associated protein 5 [Megalops cyprinoides]|uniref:cardiomyopathy-associated protein 5 n=1 Tax=Megalops cyprinoides TaxID=118141 RepID=UPI0018656430|nr:cardiomyopathy-associated protein 5 [Megalops cyprinoides]
MDTGLQEECDRVDSEMSFTELQDDSAGGDVVDEEDEVEELRNSLREIVQDDSVKPKLQCLMVDPSFSMVTVQSEDSGIVWETASSRCSTPWASEASSNSEPYSCEGSGTQGKIVIIMDEEKIVRRRKKTRSRSSLGERFRRPSSRNFPGGNERPAMTEFSVPNIRPELTDENGESIEPKQDKDQQLFSLVSEGYEILNIVVPSRLATVDEEESTEIPDNLSYLEENPRIKSNHLKIVETQPIESTPEIVEVEEDDKVIIQMEPVKVEPSEPTPSQPTGDKPTRRDGTSDMDYFEKFTLLDEHVPEDQASATEEQMESGDTQENEPSQNKDQSTQGMLASDDTFVFVSDVEIAGEHLDEVFYGTSCYAELDEPSVNKHLIDEDEEDSVDHGEPLNSPLKESGSALFGSEETILTPIFLSPGPPKIIDPTLLEEPHAMSFHYMDLYEDAVGVRKKDEDASDVESVVSETSFPRRLSDSDDTGGYLEKFILKDETPAVEDEPIPEDHPAEGGVRTLWSQSKFELTGCLTRVVEEDDTKEEERVPESSRSPSLYVECEPLIIMSEDKTEGVESLHAVVEEEAAVLGRKSPELCDDVFEPETELVEKTEADRKTDIEGTVLEHLQRSDSVGEITVIIPEETCMEVVSDKEIVEDETDVSVVDHRPESTCQEIVTDEEIKGKHEEAVVDQLTVILHQEKDAEKVVVTPEETCEVIVSDKEIVKGEADESAVEGRPQSTCEEMVTDNEEIKEKPEEAIVDQATVILHKESDAEKVVFTSEQPCEEIVSDKEIVKGEADESVVEGRPQSTCEEMVTDNEEIKEKPEEAIVDQATVILHKESDAEKVVFTSEQPCEEIVSDKEIVKGEADESVVEGRPQSTCEEMVTDNEEIKEKPEEAVVDQATVILHKESDAEKVVFTSEQPCEEIVSDKEIVKENIEEPSDVRRTESISEEIVTEKEVDKGEIQESKEVEGSKGIYEEIITDVGEIKGKNEEVVADQVTVISDQERETETEVPSEELCEEMVADMEIVKDVTEESSEVGKTKSICEEIVTDTEVVKEQNEEVFTNQEPDHIHHETVTENEISEDKTEVIDIVPEPDKTGITEDEIEETIQKPESIARNEVSRDDTEIAVTSLKSKDEDLPHTDDICTDTTEELPEEKHPAIAEEISKDLAEQDAPKAECESSPETEPQLPHELSAEDESSLIKEEDEAVLQEDTSPQHLGDSIKETTGEEQGGQIYDGKDEENIQEWHKANESISDSRTGLKRETPLLRLSPLVPVEVLEEDKGEEPTVEEPALMQDKPCSQLRSFSPHEDLSAYGKEAKFSEPEPYQYLHHEEDVSEELDYEMITQQEARELPVLDDEAEKDKEAGRPKGGLESELSHDVPADEGLETDYEIVESVDGIPLSKAEVAESESKTQAVDMFCMACRCPVSAVDKLFGNHQDHEVVTVDKAYDEFRTALYDFCFQNKLSESIALLQERSENITDLVSELELAYSSVEEHCKNSEQSLDEQNDEIMKMVMDQYNEMSHNMEEEKKVKLEQLYDRIVSFQESIDAAKEALDKTAKEVEDPDDLAFASSSTDINARLTTALDAALALELTPSAFPLFEDYAKTPSGNGQKELKGIPVPQKPHLQAQEANSATSTSVTVYWRVNEGDIIDCFQVYCMEEPQGAISEEYRVTVKESYCTLEDLEPDKCYKVWVMAVNYTGCSLPSEKLSFKTAPSVPTIDTERCTVCWDSATIRWSPAHPATVESYTLEYCRQYACEGEGLRSISGIRSCEQKVLLNPNENYLFYIKAANSAGASEQSEAALISTRGTRFHFLTDTANPSLELSEDKTTVNYQEEAYNQRATINECPAILGELLPPRGYHYWETTVGSSEAYRIGVAYPSTAPDSPLGENNTSWCIHCVPTATSCRFELLHDSVQTAIFVVDVPTRIGTMLDFLHERLSFYNAQNGQLLGSHCHKFTEACHAVLALEKPGTLALHMVMEVPEFAKH